MHSKIAIWFLGILSVIFFYKITCEFTYSDKWRWNFFHFHWIWIWENNVHLSKEFTSCCVISQRVYGLLSLASPYFTLTHCYNKFSKQVEKIDKFASIATIFSTKMPCSVWCSIYFTMKYSIYPRLSFIFPFQYQVNTLLTADTHTWHVCALPPYYARWYATSEQNKIIVNLWHDKHPGGSIIIIHHTKLSRYKAVFNAILKGRPILFFVISMLIRDPVFVCLFVLFVFCVCVFVLFFSKIYLNILIMVNFLTLHRPVYASEFAKHLTNHLRCEPIGLILFANNVCQMFTVKKCLADEFMPDDFH